MYRLVCWHNQAEADAKAIFDAFHKESAAAKKAISAAKRATGELAGPPVPPQLLEEMLAYCACRDSLGERCAGHISKTLMASPRAHLSIEF